MACLLFKELKMVSHTLFTNTEGSCLVGVPALAYGSCRAYDQGATLRAPNALALIVDLLNKR